MNVKNPNEFESLTQKIKRIVKENTPGTPENLKKRAVKHQR